MKNINIEVWKDIKGYEKQYQVSNLGNVRSLNYHRSGKCKIMKLSLNHIGYLYVCLKVNGIQKTYRVAESLYNHSKNHLL